MAMAEFGRNPSSCSSSSSSLEVKVVYLRVSPCPLGDDSPPEALTVRFPARAIGTHLEVNGARIPPSEVASLWLRRDRLDAESVEVTYVSTDHLLLALGCSVSFEVWDREEVLLAGSLQLQQQQQQQQQQEWSMDCSCSVGKEGCVFTRGGRVELLTIAPSLEICIVGCCSGSPTVLSKTVPLLPRRRSIPRCSLDAIPEDDEECGRGRDKNSLAVARNEASPDAGKLFLPEETGYGEGEDGEMSWFNAGVRVGVGIGLGMCLGVGIGVGLMVRTYQATTRSFRRRLF